MESNRYKYIILLVILFMSFGYLQAYSQKAKQRRAHVETDSTSVAVSDSLAEVNRIGIEKLYSPIDTVSLVKKSDSIHKRQYKPKKVFVPDSRKAVWLAMVIPGGGQFYNRKYWKLPIIYGGFMGCAYALNWNNNMYNDYSQAYLDIMDDDPKTSSFQDFLPPGYSISGQEERFKEIFRKRKDLYRRQRDLSIFAFIGVYVLSIIDAYVDAELSNFDISKDISMKVSPTCINNKGDNNLGAVGLQCSIKF